ncbi:MAG: hypothetical protein LBD79_11215 [Treponema sp.]|nr:hypothetical protein [Treponema sp.]
MSNGSQENQDKNLGLNIFADFFSRKDAANIENIPSTTALFDHANRMSRDYFSYLVEKKDPNVYVINIDIGTEIGDAKNAYFWSVISGNRSIGEWDSYVAGLKSSGLDRILAELKTIYDQQQVELRQYLAAFR